MLLTFDFKSDVPIYQQIRNQIVIGIADGKLKPGDSLPTVRGLAEESGINSMTVSKAYQLLKAEGFIYTDRRCGAIVAEGDSDVKLSEEVLKALKLRISELRLSGMSEEEVVELCRKFYEEK